MIDVDPTLLTWVFLIGGMLLMLLELVIPGGVTFFLGVGALLMAGLRAVGLFADPVTAVIVWVLLSTGLTIVLRPIASRYFGGMTSFGITDEDAEAVGQTVTVVSTVREETPGRIRFRGATWDARTVNGPLPEGAEARILYRDNLTWIVEPVDHSDLDQELADAIGADSLDDVDDVDDGLNADAEDAAADRSSPASSSRTRS